MVKQSFIGDMWKAAVEIKKIYELNEYHGEVNIKVHYLNGKYTYVVTNSVNLFDANTAMLFNIDSINKILITCQNIEKMFNVNCQFVVENYTSRDRIAGYLIQ